MKLITLPLAPSGFVDIFLGTATIAVSTATRDKNPNECRVHDGLHTNGGWHVALSASAVVKLIKEAKDL